MKTHSLALVVFSTVAVVSLDAGRATADGFSMYIGGSDYGCYGGRTSNLYNAYYGSRFGARYGWYGNYYSPPAAHSWHDTSHWDYHPGGFVPHYDHFDYVPGHYDYHQEGHWDHHHHW